jgi:hypothetical protein
MIFRRYGNRLLSVRPNFDELAITEIGFRRDHEVTLSAEELETEFERATEHVLSAEAEGDVQREVEDAVLRELEQRLVDLEQSLADGGVLVVENEPGRDPARTVGRQTTRVVGTENRYHFHYTVDPPLRVGVYRRRGAAP